MLQIPKRVYVLLNASLTTMIDRAIETNSLEVIDEYIRQVERNLKVLDEFKELVMENAQIFRRKYEECDTKVELAQTYYEQWQSLEE